MNADIEQLRRDPGSFAKLGLTEIVDHYEQIIGELETPSVIIGYGFGGLVTQILLDRGWGAAGVAIASAPPKGVFRSLFRNLKLALKGRSLTSQQFHYDFANTLGDAASVAAFKRYVVPAPNRILRQVALANFSPDAPSTVRFHNDSRAPLLLVAGGKDRVVPSSMVKANFDSYRESKAETDYKEFPEQTHFTLVHDALQKVPDYVLGWALYRPNGSKLKAVSNQTDTWPAEELAVMKRVREFMETKVAPVITDYWVRDAFPFDLLPAVKELGIGGVGMKGYGCAGGSLALLGFIQMEIARVDPSFSTFVGVHNGLAMGSIYIDGSEEQKQKWLPPMARFDKVGCFGLTEPLVGSGASGGLLTTAKRDGDTWILNGEKRWIGNAPWCDISIIWARDVTDNQVKGFIVENKTTPGFSVEKIENKIALKVVQNGHITLKDCRVPEENRLQGGNSFRDTAKVLKMTRYAVAWMSTGCAMGAYEAALKYSQERLQFGRPIGSFQLVQDLLARMIENITASQCLLVRQAQLFDEGKLSDAHAALSKAFCTSKCRETVAWAREILGGNGIVADYKVARFFNDCEALYTYEGTFQMQNLIVGKAVTGLSAFL